MALKPSNYAVGLVNVYNKFVIDEFSKPSDYTVRLSKVLCKVVIDEFSIALVVRVMGLTGT